MLRIIGYACYPPLQLVNWDLLYNMSHKGYRWLDITNGHISNYVHFSENSFLWDGLKTKSISLPSYSTTQPALKFVRGQLQGSFILFSPAINP